LLSIALASLAWAPMRRVDLVLSAAMLLPAALFTARTRYRFAALPGLVTAAGATCSALLAAALGDRREHWVAFPLWMLAIGGMTLLFATAPRRAERRWEGQAIQSEGQSEGQAEGGA
jgi:hypothetical protein